MFEKKNNFRSKRREVRQLRRRVLVSGSVACVALVVGVLVWYGARRPEVTLSQITVEGGATVSHEVVRSRAESLLSGTYALLIPRTFAFLFPQQELVDAINTIPRVHNASVIRASRTELQISFDEYMPYALWCDAAPEASSTPSLCMFVDDTGYSYAEAPSLLGETLVRFVIDGRVPERGVYVYDTETLTRYRAFASAIGEKHQQHLRAITETKEGDLVLHLSNNVDLLTIKSSDIQEIFANIESVFQSEEFKDTPLDEFEYIDLRFGNKVYAKKRGVEVADPSIATNEESPRDTVAASSELSSTTESVVNATSTQ